MFKLRNLLAVGSAILMMLILTTPWAAAQPVQQGTVTPEATIAATDTPVPTDTLVPTVAATETMTATATSVAPAVSPLATPVSTPSTLPTTGGSDDGTATASLLLVIAGVVILLGIIGAGAAMSRRTR